LPMFVLGLHLTEIPAMPRQVPRVPAAAAG
jgi:hypothetical protein